MLLKGSCHSICRKTAGGGGERHFCAKCASALWVRDKRWPEWIYPFASAIDTRLPLPPERQLA